MFNFKKQIHSTFKILCVSVLLFNVSCKVEPEHIKESADSRYCLNQRIKEKIQVEKATKHPVTESIMLTGVVEPNPDLVIPFVSLLDGIISKTYFSLGDKVAKGQVLAELMSSQLVDLQSQYKVLQAQKAVAEKKLQSVKAMYDDGIASLKELTEAQSELDMLVAEQEKINNTLKLYSGSTNKNVFQIKSPASGIITAKAIAPGAQITANDAPLFTVTNLSEIWVSVNVYASHVKHVSIGMPVQIKTLSYPNEIFKGTISAIAPILDAEAKVLRARVVLPNSDFKLKPGMIVDVTAIKELNQEAVAIPTSALIFDDNQNYVVVYKDDCDLEIRQVELISKSNGLSFISSGLAENESVITRNQLLIYEQIKNFR